MWRDLPHAADRPSREELIPTRVVSDHQLFWSAYIRIGTSPAHQRLPACVRLWCETACAIELLDYDPQTGYQLAPYMDELLGQPDSTFYLGLFPRSIC
jgi:hypothetical protein